MILRAAGFVSSRLISGQNVVNFVYPDLDTKNR